MAQRFLGPYNGFLPQATGQVISFIRDPRKFQLNRYAQYIESPQPLGVYARTSRDQPVRVVSDADFVWADGADRPNGDWNQLPFEWVEFAVKRRDYPWRVGNMALRSAKDSWKPLEQHAGMAASQAMTNRTARVISLLEAAAGWGASTDTASALNQGAGKWNTASSEPADGSYNAIRKSLMQAAMQVNLYTNGVVEPSDLVLIINPVAAMAIANSPEVHNYVKFGPFSKAQLEGTGNVNMMWGLPPSLYGFELVVEDATRVTMRPNSDGTQATGTDRGYIKASDSALMVSRKGGINGVYGGRSFSTVQLYWHEWEMAVFTFDDPKNERTDGHVTDCFAEVIAAPEAGFLITGIL